MILSPDKVLGPCDFPDRTAVHTPWTAESLVGSTITRTVAPTGDLPGLSILIPVYGKANLTRRCVAAVAATVGLPPTRVEILIGDDASPTPVDAVVLASVARPYSVRVLRHDRQSGFLLNAMSLAEHAVGSVICFLNNDAVPLPGWAAALLNLLQSDQRVGIVGPVIEVPNQNVVEIGNQLFADGSVRCVVSNDPGNGVRETDFVGGACLMMRRAHFFEVGGFDSLFAPAYYEDVDLCLKVARAGLRILIEPKARVIHESFGTHGHAQAVRLSETNRRRLLQKWGEMLGRFALPPSMAAVPQRGRPEVMPPVTVLVYLHDAHGLPDPDFGAWTRFLEGDWLLIVVDARSAIGKGVTDWVLPRVRYWREGENCSFGRAVEIAVAARPEADLVVMHPGVRMDHWFLDSMRRRSRLENGEWSVLVADALETWEGGQAFLQMECSRFCPQIRSVPPSIVWVPHALLHPDAIGGRPARAHDWFRQVASRAGGIFLIDECPVRIEPGAVWEPGLLPERDVVLERWRIVLQGWRSYRAGLFETANLPARAIVLDHPIDGPHARWDDAEAVVREEIARAVDERLVVIFPEDYSLRVLEVHRGLLGRAWSHRFPWSVPPGMAALSAHEEEVLEQLRQCFALFGVSAVEVRQPLSWPGSLVGMLDELGIPGVCRERRRLEGRPAGDPGYWMRRFVSAWLAQTGELLDTRQEQRADSRKPDRVSTRIDFISDLHANCGLGVSARAMIQGLEYAGYRVHYGEVPMLSHRRLEQRCRAESPAGEEADLVFVHVNPNQHPLADEPTIHRRMDGRAAIGYWYWELPRLPASFQEPFKGFREIWVATRYTQEHLALVSQVPVLRMPPAVVVSRGSGVGMAEIRARMGLPTDRFLFLNIFNVHSSVARKNPFGLLEAFRRAFPPGNGAPRLVMRVHHLNDYAGSALADALEESAARADAVLLREEMDRTDLMDLVRACDAYVALHRSEGLGLPLLEAMALGKPVVATAATGNMDYMHLDNSMLVRAALRPITADEHALQPGFGHLYEAGQIWAEPDLDHAAHLMRSVAGDPGLAERLGRQAARDVAADYSMARSSARIRERLEALGYLP